MAQDLAPYIYLPLPSLSDLPSSPASRQERLKTILANLERQQQTVRNNIIAAAKRRQEAAQLATQSHHSDSDAMDTSGSTHDEGEIRSPANQSAMDDLIANLNAPHEGSVDPILPADFSFQNRVPQERPPSEIQLAKETLDLIELYNRHAEQAKELYVKALERMSGSVSSAITKPQLSGVPYGSGPGASNYGAANRVSASPSDFGQRSVGSTGGYGVSPRDPSRDPRRRAR